MFFGFNIFFPWKLEWSMHAVFKGKTFSLIYGTIIDNFFVQLFKTEIKGM
jgi:hypothetical protein